MRDRAANTTECISFHSNGTVSDGRSERPKISDNGNVVAFLSHATNLVDGDTNNTVDAFVHYRDPGETMGETIRVSVGNNGEQANNLSGELDLSGDGNLVVFTSHANNLVFGE